MKIKYYVAWLLMLLCKPLQATINTSEQPSSALLPLEARSVDSSAEDDVVSTSYVLPNQIFNDGKPYYARQDPISGQLDFNSKKPAGIEPEMNEVLHSKEKIILNSGSNPNIHDFLNLPVKYSSANFVYPLVSSSYANLKYQGSNKNYMTNKKPTLVVAPVTPVPPKYNNESSFTVETTKLTAITSTEANNFSVSIKDSSSAIPKSTSAPSQIDVTTPKRTTARYITTRRPIKITVSSTTLPSQLSAIRKKFLPAKKNSQNSSLSNIENAILSTQPRPTQSSSHTTFTTHHPTPQASIFPTETTSITKMFLTSTTRQPLVFSADEIAGNISNTTPITVIDNKKIATLEAADVYHTLGQKNTKDQSAQPPLTLSEIFNSLVEEEGVVAHNYQQNQGFDAQGNLIVPISPSQPSPFAMQPQSVNQQTLSGVHSAAEHQNEQKLLSGNLGNHGNEYVSYQVQQPNVLPYRPTPGQINNVVISPDQQSASFVLGSQQQVSHQSSFGNIEKEKIFSKDSTSVLYGQVINEDIGKIKRTQSSSQKIYEALQKATQTSHSDKLQNALPNIKSEHVIKAPVILESASPGDVVLTGINELPPEAPTSYQQLPLIASNLHPSKPQAKKIPAVISTIVAAPPSNQDIQSSVQTTSPNYGTINKDTKELLVSTNIRFPVNGEELTSSVTLSGPPVRPHINGHAQPLSLQQIQNANPIVFPKIINKDVGESTVQIQQHEVINIKQHKQQLTFPTDQQSDNHQQTQSISQIMEPPPRSPASHVTPVLSSVKRPSGVPVLHVYKEFHRKAESLNQKGQRPNNNLPNILPQFRPNAKISNGHTPNIKQELENIHLHTQDVNLAYNPSTLPKFAHRRQPLPHQQLQKRFPLNRISEHEYIVESTHPAGSVNRRIYRLPPNGGQRIPQLRNGIYARRPTTPLRSSGGYQIERHAPTAPELYKLINDDIDNLEEEDLVINHPPHAPKKDHTDGNESKLEAVVTLQMLKSQKQAIIGDDNGDGEIQVTTDNDSQDENLQKISQNVSETFKEYKDLSLHQNALPTALEYQNTPFSVIREEPQEPILKNKKPQSLQQQAKIQKLSSEKFPYPIEKPNPSYSELQPTLQVPGVLIAPRIMNSAFNSATEAPIAIAYTPTVPNSIRRNISVKQEQNFSNTKHALSKENQVHSIKRTEELINNDYDLRGHNFEKNFMAPFYPSISLGGGSDVVTENPTLDHWNIVSPSSDQTIYNKNNINRIGIEEEVAMKEIKHSNSTDISSAKYLELDNFQPQLQGGFKPIYPPNYVYGTQSEQSQIIEDMELKQHNLNPLALALKSSQTTLPPNTAQSPLPPNTELLQTTTHPILPSNSTSNQFSTRLLAEATIPAITEPLLSDETSTSTTTTKAPMNKIKPTQQRPKKSTFETSLASLLFGDGEENEDGARKSINNKNGPINVARMGPRSLVLRNI